MEEWQGVQAGLFILVWRLSETEMNFEFRKTTEDDSDADLIAVVVVFLVLVLNSRYPGLKNYLFARNCSASVSGLLTSNRKRKMAYVTNASRPFNITHT